jgi:hypothetical protein
MPAVARETPTIILATISALLGSDRSSEFASLHPIYLKACLLGFLKKLAKFSSPPANPLAVALAPGEVKDEQDRLRSPRRI